MTIEELAENAISILNKRITNEIFLIIQSDRDLMHEYLHLVEEKNLQTVNMGLGKKIKQAYGLDNLDEREDNPSCTLIKSHQKFE